MLKVTEKNGQKRNTVCKASIEFKMLWFYREYVELVIALLINYILPFF
jgi:hypothetical protein